MSRQPSRREFVRRAAQASGWMILTSCAGRSLRSSLPRVGFIVGDEPVLITAFTDALREYGYVPGSSLDLEMRVVGRTTGGGSAMASELAHLDLDLIVAGSLPFALAIREANPAMPMVIATCPGMVSNGFAQTLERPGGIVTGMDELPAGLTAKRLSLLTAAAPHISRIALLSTTPGRGGHEAQLADAERAAVELQVTVRSYRAATADELNRALAAIAADGMHGLQSFQGGLALGNRRRIIEFAAQHRLPGIYQATLFAQDGGLMAWAPDLPRQFRIAAGYVNQILRGARPGDLPVRHPERYYLTINREAARRIGLSIPDPVLAQTDRVI